MKSTENFPERLYSEPLPEQVQGALKISADVITYTWDKLKEPGMLEIRD